MSKDLSSKYISVILYGGLGNQMFQYSTALSIAAKEDARVKFLLLGNTRNTKDGLPDITQFRIPYLHSSSYEIAENSSLTKILIKISLQISSSGRNNFFFTRIKKLLFRIIQIFLSFRIGQMVCIPFERGYDEEFNPRNTRYAILGNFQSYKWISNQAYEILMSDLKLSKENNEIETFFKLSAIEKPIALHIRLGDYTEIQELNVIDPNYFRKALEHMRQNNYQGKIWIFTNDVEKCISYIPSSEFPNTRFIPNYFNASETLEIMRMCTGHIISNSTFSWWGAYLKYEHHGVVIAPKKWFASKAEPREICPPAWIRL